MSHAQSYNPPPPQLLLSPHLLRRKHHLNSSLPSAPESSCLLSLQDALSTESMLLLSLEEAKGVQPGLLGQILSKGGSLGPHLRDWQACDILQLAAAHLPLDLG